MEIRKTNIEDFDKVMEIYEGSWINDDESYGVVHRIASSSRQKGCLFLYKLGFEPMWKYPN